MRRRISGQRCAPAESPLTAAFSVGTVFSVRAVSLAGTVLLAGAVLVAGCSPSATAPSRSATTGSATPVARATTATTPAPVSQALPLCAGRLPAALADQLARVVPGSTEHEVVPLGVTADGTTGYASVWTPEFSGVAAVELRTGAIRPIMRFASPGTDQADGAWGGQWLVWEETYSLQSLDDFTVYAWNAAAGRVTRLGHSVAGPAGAAWPSPWHAPAVSGGYAAWAEGDGPGGLVEIRLADLRTGRVSTVAEGHLQAPVFADGLLVWPGSGRPGALTSLTAYDLADHRTVPLPVALRTVTGTDFIASNGTAAAYLNPALTELYYSPAPDQAARVLLRLPAGEEFSELGLAAGALTWTTTAATYLGSPATGRYVKVTSAYGFAVTGSGPAVLVSDAPVTRSPRPILPLHVLDAQALNAQALPANPASSACHPAPPRA